MARGAARKRAGKNHARRERLARVRRVTSLSRPSQSIAATFARPPCLPAHPDVRRASLRRPPCRSGPPRLCFPTSAVHASPRRLPRLCSPRLPAPSAAPFWSAVRGRERSAAVGADEQLQPRRSGRNQPRDLHEEEEFESEADSDYEEEQIPFEDDEDEILGANSFED